jgi:hypothetical protein
VATGSYYRDCRTCGRRIQMRKMPHGQWVAFEGYGTQHQCKHPPASRAPLWVGAEPPHAAERAGDPEFVDISVPSQAATQGGANLHRPVAVRSTGRSIASQGRTPTSQARAGKSAGRQWIGMVVAGLVVLLVIGFWPDGYWYCWNSGPAQPHRLGTANACADHGCNHFDVWLNGNPSRPRGR